jgi:hypothetical protein
MEKEGYSSPTNWASSCVMAALNDAPAPAEAEREALGASTRQIAAVGRNLNQLVRALNADPSEAHVVTAKLVAALSEKLDGHIAATTALLDKTYKQR